MVSRLVDHINILVKIPVKQLLFLHSPRFGLVSEHFIRFSLLSLQFTHDQWSWPYQPASTWMHWATRILVHYLHWLHFHPTLLVLSCSTVTSGLKLTFPMMSSFIHFTNCWPLFCRKWGASFLNTYFLIFLVSCKIMFPVFLFVHFLLLCSMLLSYSLFKSPKPIIEYLI